MRKSRPVRPLCILVIACLCTGCGTLANVTAPVGPVADCRAFGPTTCVPFGGVQRSIGDGSAFFLGGPVGIISGLAVFAVDAPFSLIGDVVTLPIVYARQVSEANIPTYPITVAGEK